MGKPVSAGERRELLAKLETAATGLVQLGFQAYGSSRANRYKAHSVQLANTVFQCYQVDTETAASVGVPLAATVERYLPDEWLQGMASTFDPLACLGALYVAFSQCTANEKHVVDKWQEHFVSRQSAPAEATAGAAGATGADVGVVDDTADLVAEAMPDAGAMGYAEVQPGGAL